jgi:hypothetical protein
MLGRGTTKNYPYLVISTSFFAFSGPAGAEKCADRLRQEKKSRTRKVCRKSQTLTGQQEFALQISQIRKFRAIIDFPDLHPYKPPHVRSYKAFDSLARSKNNAPCFMQIQEGPHSAVFKINEAYLSTI